MQAARSLLNHHRNTTTLMYVAGAHPMRHYGLFDKIFSRKQPTEEATPPPTASSKAAKPATAEVKKTPEQVAREEAQEVLLQAEAARLKAKQEQEEARLEAQLTERDQTILNIENEKP